MKVLKKDKSVHIRLNSEFLEHIDLAAEFCELTRSGYIRSAILCYLSLHIRPNEHFEKLAKHEEPYDYDNLEEEDIQQLNQRRRPVY